MTLNKSIVLATALAVAATSAPILTATSASAATSPQLTNTSTARSLAKPTDHKAKEQQLAQKKKAAKRR